MPAVRDVVAIDLHAGGEPGRVVVGGVPDVPARDMFEKMQYFQHHLARRTRGTSPADPVELSHSYVGG